MCLSHIMGDHKLVYSDHYDVQQADVLETHLLIITLSPLLPSTQYMHKDVWYWHGISIKFVIRRPVSVNTLGDQICIWDGCKHLHGSAPEQHILCWCPQCAQWFHLDCLGLIDMYGVEVSKLIGLPIERNHAASAPLWSSKALLGFSQERFLSSLNLFSKMNWKKELFADALRQGETDSGISKDKVKDAMQMFL
ncbi:uncharacterized protein B0H18DRAFT_1119347 [Fomitopsis serialis]|uniref:uncharacterized protein n=1 Tax=Fomitopsis serialis TaxID=139415 RepID=UPI002008C1CB|nr:uncharacterized protein B0H18DRAFT_1119347 [Neoantrodia serialis]KAH9925506.1 hypothetical protein B0H18DRAFT_1119347 [Neoantrodia serialis]